MPRVPRAPDERVRLQPLAQPATPGAPPKDLIGGPAAAEFRQAQRGMTQQASKLMLDEQKKADDLAILEFDNEAANLRLDRWTAARKRLGKDALSATEEFLGVYQKDLDELEGNLNTRQLPRAKALRGRHELELKGKLENHAYQQGLVYDNQTTKARLQTYQNEAIDNYDVVDERGNRSFLQRNLNEAVAEIGKWADRTGASEEVKEQKIDAFLSKTHSSVINVMLARGQEKTAKDYYDENRLEVVGDDKRLVEKMFKVFRSETERQVKQQRAEVNDDIEHELWNRHIDGKVTLSEADKLFDDEVIDRSFYKELRNAIIDPNYDDPAIPETEKMKRQLELFDAFLGLKGAKVDDNGKIIRPATDNDIASLQNFRTSLMQSRGYLPRKVVNDYLKYTQRNFNEPYEAKRGLLRKLWASLQAAAVPSRMVVEAMHGAIGEIMAPGVSVEDAATITDRLSEAQVVKSNPNRTLYKVGEMVYAGSMTGEVVGYTKGGEPLVKWRKQKQ